jgi:peroxiredoxin
MNRRRFAPALALLVSLSALPPFAAPEARAAAEIGAAAPAFSLAGADGENHSLAAEAGKVVVLEWLNHGCPFVRKHYSSGNMQALQRDYTGKGVVWFSIVSSAPGKQGHCDAEEASAQASEQKSAATAVLLDPDGTVGHAYGARTTPHLFVVAADGTVAYKGAIDDTPSADPDDVPKAHNYVRAALDALLAGATPEPASTTPYGCSVKY